MDNDIGIHGGIALRKIFEGGRKFVRGATIPSDITSKWPLKARRAMNACSAIQFFAAPAPKAQKDKKPKRSANKRGE